MPSALVQIPQGINGSLLRIGDTFRTTVSRIESYYNCPFSYFLTYGLRLRPREEAELQMYDLGTVMHNLIDEASESLFEMPGDFDAAQCRELIDSVYERVASKMRFVNTELTKREEYALKRIRNYAGIAFYNLKRQIDSGKFVPCGFEVPFDFSQDSLLKPVTLTPPEENAPFQKLHVVGRIDRYDTLDQDGIKYVRVVDYKSAPVSLSERELSAGTKLQLITYLNAVIDSYPKGTAAPGGVLYFQFNDDIASAKDHISCVESIERGKQFVMNGFVLDRKEVVDGMTGGRDTGVIGGRLLQKGGISFSSNKLLKSAEEFESMRQEAYGNILRAGEKIAKGSYSIAPSPVPEISPCQYCNLRSICASCADV